MVKQADSTHLLSRLMEGGVYGGGKVHRLRQPVYNISESVHYIISAFLGVSK